MESQLECLYHNPESVGSYENYFRQCLTDDSVFQSKHAYFKNVGYSLQYLEYLERFLEVDVIHASVRRLTQKTFITVGMSVIEAILWYVVKANDAGKVEEWEVERTQVTNQYSESGITKKMTVIVERLREVPKPVDMNLDWLCKRAEKRSLLGVDSKVYAKLNWLRQLRNRIHIHVTEHDQDTDWWKIGSAEVAEMKSVLHAVVCCDLFKNSEAKQSLFDFLKEAPKEI